MLRITSEHYQHRSIRQVKRAKGFAWEFRYYVHEGAKRSLELQTFDSSIYKTYKTEKAERQHLEGFLVKLNEKTEYLRGKDRR